MTKAVHMFCLLFCFGKSVMFTVLFVIQHSIISISFLRVLGFFLQKFLNLTNQNRTKRRKNYFQVTFWTLFQLNTAGLMLKEKEKTRRKRRNLKLPSSVKGLPDKKDEMRENEVEKQD